MENINLILLIILLLIQIYIIKKVCRINSFFRDRPGIDKESEEKTDDELYEEAKRITLEAGKASASYLQRRLRTGYARAARLLDMLEDNGIVGPAIGNEPREVYDKKENK
ncbi:DNA translocase FtsK [Patescibacteria group bacterium]